MNVKRLIILCLPIVFALSLAITLAACMAQAGKNIGDSALDGESTTDGRELVSSSTVPSYSEGLTYKKMSDGTSSVTSLGTCTDLNVRIPEKDPDGVRITSIADSAFLGSNIKSVALPTGIRSIGAYAFYGSSIESITLPAALKQIGECCFANCKFLKGISVDSANENYCSIDGVLFTESKNVLICYPSGKTDTEYTIRFGVESIASAAFYGCSHLKSVKFNGNAEAWERVKVGANNDSLLALKITFKEEDIK